MDQSKIRNFCIIAHRGYSSKAPENTIMAFDLAIKRGFSFFEFDVQLTRDNRPIVFHDDLLDRTTDGHGHVSSATLTELSSLDAGKWFNEDYANIQIPTLDQVLIRYFGKAHIYLELKSKQANLAAVTARCLKDNKWLTTPLPSQSTIPGLTITSFYLNQLKLSISALPRWVMHEWTVREINNETIDEAINADVTGISVHAKYITKEIVERARLSGLDIRAWAIKSDLDLINSIKSGATGATVNWPSRARKMLEELVDS